MCYPQILCHHSAAAGQPFTFYILSKGGNAGQPQLLPWANSFAVNCKTKEDLDFYFWLSYSLWQTGRFKPYLRGSVVPFITVTDIRQLISSVAESISPHWHTIQNVIEALNKLKTAKEHLSQCIMANEKLQSMLLRILSNHQGHCKLAPAQSTLRSINTLPITQGFHLYSRQQTGAGQEAVLLFFNLKSFVMSAVNYFVGRRRRPWVSYILTGCYKGLLVHAVYRCPIVNGIPYQHLAWLHKIVLAS